MRFSTLLVLSAGVGLLSSALVLNARKPAKAKKPKAVDWNNRFYSTKFHPCKKLRIFNPVELVKAQVFAAEVFRKCMPRIVIKYATKFNFPAYGIERLGYLGCLGVNIFFGYLADDGSLIVGYDVKTSDVWALIRALCNAFLPLNLNITIKHERKRLSYPLNNLIEFGWEALECVLDGEYVPVTDGDVVKHGVDHIKFILL